MAQDTWLADQIEVIVSGVLTLHHRMQTAAGVLGEFILSAFSTSGVFRSADGRELTVRRVSWWRSLHEMREGQMVLGQARPRGFWRQDMVVEFGGRVYQLKPASFWSRDWQLVDEVGTVLVEVKPRGFFRRGAYLTILGPLEADLLAFTYYLVNARWQEQAAAAAS